MSFKAYFSLAVLGTMMYLGFKLIPPYVSNYEFTEDLAGIARLSSYAREKSEEDIRAEIVAKARERDILVRPKDVSVVRSGGMVNINVKYTVRVDLPKYPVDLNFNPTVGNTNIVGQ